MRGEVSFMERTATAIIGDGKIKCSIYGDMTGIDCRCMQDDPCKGCFIFDAFQELKKVQEGLSLE